MLWLSGKGHTYSVSLLKGIVIKGFWLVPGSGDGMRVGDTIPKRTGNSTRKSLLWEP